MIPYDGLYFFYFLFLLLIPAVILGFCEKTIKYYGIAVTIIIILMIFGQHKVNMLSLILFYASELILIKAYLHIRKIYKQRWILWIVIVCAIVPLILTKYGVTLIHRSVGFLGISYVTFKVVQILIEIYDGLIKEISIKDFTYFILFFPTISSGPIDRFRRFKDDANKVMDRDKYCVLLREGIWKIAKGITYKFVFGVLIYTYWLNKIPQGHNFTNTLNYMYAYSFYLFFDFAGYSLMAIGAGYVLGIATPENFNMPFLSKDIKEFWNRWHMTLSFWLRDFLYTRFVMSSIKKKWFKNRYTASYIGFMMNMLVMGIWHGTETFYILYGLYHGILIVCTDYFERKSNWYKKVKNKNGWNILFTFITFNLVCFGFLIFSGYLFKK